MSEYRGRFTGEDEKDVIDLDKIRKDVARRKHDQTVQPSPPTTEEFVETQFVCYMNDIHYNRRGDVVVSLTIPYRYRIFAKPLVDSYGIPLSADFQRWKPFDEHRAKQQDGS